MAVVEKHRKVEAADGGHNKQGNENRSIIIPDALVSPHAVVVHHRDALVAHAAMMRPRWLRLVALQALSTP